MHKFSYKSADCLQYMFFQAAHTNHLKPGCPAFEKPQFGPIVLRATKFKISAEMDVVDFKEKNVHQCKKIVIGLRLVNANW